MSRRDKPSAGTGSGKPATGRKRASKRQAADATGTTADAGKPVPGQPVNNAAATGSKGAKGKPAKPRAARPGTPRPAVAKVAAQHPPGNDSAAPTSAAPTSAPLMFRATTPVRWRDLDAFNHVNNSQYLSYLEEARLQWMMTIPGEWIDEEVAPVVAAAQINYRQPIAWPAELAVELFVQRLGDTSITIGHRILAAGDGSVLYADGHVVMVWIGRHDGRPARLPDAVRAACAPG